MRELIVGLPPGVAAAALFGAVVLAVLVVGLIVVAAGSAVTRTASADGPSLAESADPLLRSRRGVGRFNAEFDRLAESTQLGIDGGSAIGWILLGGALLGAIVYLCTFPYVAPANGLLLALFAILIGGSTVLLFFYLLRNRRRRAIQEQLPDGCFQLARSLRSGLALPGALRETSNYLPAPLSKLFGRLAAALMMGESTRAALRRAAADAQVTEFDLFAEVLAMNAESGGNLPAMLDRLAAAIRDRNQYRGYFRSVTMLARMAAVFLALIGPAALIMYLFFDEQRELLLRFIQAPYGQGIILLAIVLEVIGLLWIVFLLRRQDDY